jgi:hypothetical protein
VNCRDFRFYVRVTIAVISLCNLFADAFRLTAAYSHAIGNSICGAVEHSILNERHDLFCHSSGHCGRSPHSLSRESMPAQSACQRIDKTNFFIHGGPYRRPAPLFQRFFAPALRRSAGVAGGAKIAQPIGVL